MELAESVHLSNEGEKIDRMLQKKILRNPSENGWLLLWEWLFLMTALQNKLWNEKYYYYAIM